MLIDIDRRTFIASLGGAAVVKLMSHEDRADALEDYCIEQLDLANSPRKLSDEELELEWQQQQQQQRFPTVAELEAQIDTRNRRRGVGNIFVGSGTGNVRKLEPLPAKPTLEDFFRLRFSPANHVLQSANRALKTGMSEDIILACLLHDVVQTLIKVDHGWWGAQLFEPYVSEKTTFAIRYHQALRFYADEAAGYAYPDLYHRMFGVDYVPPPYIEETYKMVRKHKWYMEPRLVTVNDLYAFEPGVTVTLDPFIDIIGRRFKQPKEGLGFDNSPVAHMWRTIANPDSPL
jgi:hypothetical protein